MSSAGISADRAPAWSLGLREQNLLVGALAAWGAALIFFENVPFLQITLPGNLLRVALLGFGLVLVAGLLPRIVAGLNGVEVLVIGAFSCLVVFAGVHGYVNGEVTSPYAVVQFIGLSVMFYVAAKGLDSEAALERYFRILYYIALFSCIQSIIAFIGNFAGYRMRGLIGFGAGAAGYIEFSFYGLLGTYAHTLRTSGYFSEPAHYCQTLIPMLFYALSRGKKIGRIVIPIGMVTTAALASLLASVVLFVVYSLRRMKFWPLIPLAGLLTLFIIPTTATILENLFQLYNRAGSLGERNADLALALDVLRNSPLGYGLVDLQTINILRAPSSGLAILIVLFGALILPFVLFIFGFLGFTGVGIPRQFKVSPLCLGLLGTAVATISAGPWFKYWMLFMLSALVTAVRIENAKRREASAPPPG